MKQSTKFICRSCGHETGKWLGKCPACDKWNTFDEVATAIESKHSHGKTASNTVPINAPTPKKLSEIKSDTSKRIKTRFNELDRVLGGGIVSGSLILVGGDPGIGKSTLLLQICNELCRNRSVL